MIRYHTSSLAGLTFALVAALLTACDDNSPTEPPPGPVAGDLIIRYVQRLPELDYVWGSDDPAHEGWPAPGSEVTWQAHVLNRAPTARTAVGYRWTLDGAVVDSGRVDLPAAGEATVDYPWTWTFERHELGFKIDPEYEVPDEGRNNSLKVFTDALSVGFYVEQSFYDLFAEHQVDLDIGSTSFEDWAQRQIRRYNEMFEAAVYPETPEGVLDRYRLDRITVVDDGTLPLAPVPDSLTDFAPDRAIPNLDDHTVDIQWGFPASAAGDYTDYTSTATNNQFYYSGFVQHEMGHARYLIDVYSLDVYDGTTGNRVAITEGGEPLPGSIYMPGTPTVYNGVEGLQLYKTPQQGLMTSDWTYIDRHSAGAFNLIAGRRATRGNYNCPENCGIYLNDLPAENRLTVNDRGAALPEASVWIYRSERNAALDTLVGYYRKYYDDIPDMKLLADDHGTVLLGRDPFSGGAGIVSEDDFCNGTIIVRVERDGEVGYGFLDVTEFNEAYWRGETEVADYALRVVLH